MGFTHYLLAYCCCKRLCSLALRVFFRCCCAFSVLETEKWRKKRGFFVLLDFFFIMRLTVAAFIVVPPDLPLVILFDAVIQFPFLFFFALIATSAMCCFITFNLHLFKKKKKKQKQKVFFFFFLGEDLRAILTAGL